MSSISRFCFLTLALSVVGACAGAHGQPSPGATALPGATGTIELRPGDWLVGETTWWVDSDGIDPGAPGCHIGVDENGSPNGRRFGEACLPDGTLVESNPAKGEIHSHTNDTGHPDTFDCAAWCVAQGASTGTCTPAPAPPCPRSAYCACE